MKCVYGWAGVRYVITKFSRMDSLPNFVTHGAPLLKTSVLTYYVYFHGDRSGIRKMLRRN